MAHMLHEIYVAGSPKAVINAIPTQEGLRARRAANCTAERKVGAMAEPAFGKRSTLFRMKVVALTARNVVWECLGDVDGWHGTRLPWFIQPIEAGTSVCFTHSGWRSIDGWFARCNSTWHELMHRLRNCLEGRNPGPLFTGQVRRVTGLQDQ